MTECALGKDRVRELLDYDKSTGLLTWKKLRRGRFGNIGDEAGSIDKTGHVRVGIDGKVYAASRVIHLWVTGALPDRMTYLDCDPQNLKWSNLADVTQGYSMTKSARIARENRAVRKAAIEIVKADPNLLRAYRKDHEEARKIMRTVSRSVRFQRARNRAANRSPDEDAQ